MTEQIAYVLGLLIGGGTISNSSFEVYLPVRKWGIDNNSNIRSISLDLATEVRKCFQEAFGIVIDYTNTRDSWRIMPATQIDITPIKDTLRTYGLPSEGVLLNNADLTVLRSSLSDYYAEYFISGICDTKGSVADSHRRFTSSAPTISIEIPGSTRNYLFVTQLCSWLHDLGAFADQILYNNPCQHAASNPFYRGWKKGFKIRFLAKEFLQSKSFSLRAKAAHAGALASQQEVEEQGACEGRSLQGRVKPICIHCDIHSDELPDNIRSRLFLHYFHVCALMKCPYAPIGELRKIVHGYRRHISALPLLEKDSVRPIRRSYNHLHNLYFPASETTERYISVRSLIESEGYSIYFKLHEALAYLFSPELNGNRHVGGMEDIINDNLKESVVMTITENLGEPIMLSNPKNQRAAIVSSIASSFNQNLLDKILTIDDLEIRVDSSFRLD